MTRASRLVLALACAGMSAGCVTTYEDRHLRGGEAAVVRHEHPIESGVVIDALDGEHPGVRVIDEYRLAPGEHAFRAHAQVGGYRSNPQTRWFTAAPGGRYRIETVVDRTHGAWGFGIVDERTGEHVDRAWQAGKAPTAGVDAAGGKFLIFVWSRPGGPIRC